MFRVDPWPRSGREGSNVAMSCGVGLRPGLDVALWWLWCRPAAKAPIDRWIVRMPSLGTSICRSSSPIQTNKRRQWKDKEKTAPPKVMFGGPGGEAFHI